MAGNLGHAKPVEVRDNQSRCRYEIWVGEELAGIEGYEIGDDGVITLLHTIIDEKYSRQGYARAMVREILDGMRARQQTFRPVCTYVQRFLTRFPEYRELAAPSDGAGVAARAD
ncbi:N-acetyltransferase [Hoyosella sp. YIM 151337]|uniref:GNAT family N-acetyltransferase n=1 Tax=Hoyosella sp. YIM 151337 TaxID=2992742 RepID=UPI0022364FD3|nr:GNAT family N-acetyltransferase [Hoyosella sp. YIM 151337]MCW4351821.1 N-acetyltransferase [Hoyosella sp. YIM 151337]